MMKIIHTADLHLGQELYQNYERYDEHLHFFKQLRQWCQEERPDALLVSGDVFDIQQPSIKARELFNEQFVQLQKQLPDMHVVIIAGNHDSASRIHADRTVWTFSNTHLVGLPPSMDAPENWQDNYIIEIDKGFIVAMPYMLGDRSGQLQSILDRVAERNTNNKPVVMMGHLAIANSDVSGHDFDIGKIRTQTLDSLGVGYDYLALGHLHKPQTIGHPEDGMKFETVSYPAPVIRYSGSALHVSCDETYPHTVSVVEIDHHGGQINLRQLRINELRHFYVLPETADAFASEEMALESIKNRCKEKESCYIRLKINNNVELSSDFTQKVYDLLKENGDHVRYNPRIIWIGQDLSKHDESKKPLFELNELQQMTDPIEFIEKTRDLYPKLDFSTLRQVFDEIEAEIRRIHETEVKKNTAKS